MRKMLMLGVFLAIVLLAVSGCTGQAAKTSADTLRTTDASRTVTVKANSCDADATCEMNAVDVTNDNVRIGRMSNGIDPLLAIYRVQANGMTQFDVHANTAFYESNIFVGLAGEGHAYSCLNDQGLLFRSDTPCTDNNADANQENNGTNYTHCRKVDSEANTIEHVSDNEAVVRVHGTCGADEVLVTAGGRCATYDGTLQQAVLTYSNPNFDPTNNRLGWYVECSVPSTAQADQYGAWVTRICCKGSMQFD